MSLKYVGETALQENIVKTKEHVESVRATLDAAKQDKIELATMPQASADNLGLVVIYTGSTTSTYTHGYMYECVSDGETPATYSWEQLTSDVKIDNTTIVKDAYTGELSAALATTHSLGIVKGGTGTMIGDHGEVNVYQRLQEDYVGNPGSRVSVPYYDSKFRLNKEDNGNYKKGGIYELQINAVTPVGTENPSEEGWYEYTGTYGDDSEYELTEDTTVDSEKTYYTIAWELVSANSQEFNTDDFEIENNVVSLDVTQRSFTGSAAEWELVEDKSIYTIVNLTDDEPTKIIPLYADMAVGTIVPFGGSTSVDGFLLCDGSEYNRTDYPELFEVIGTSFGTPSANTKFKVPDLREAVPKGAGLTGYTVGAHLDADGLAVGEFLDDRVQEHTHSAKASATPGNNGSSTAILMGNTDTSTGVNTGRKGATTEVKAVGVNYLIKARQVALPIDLERQVVEANEYSTTETIVGKWIDGKPIYRKVIGTTTTATSNSNTYEYLTDLINGYSNIPDIGTIINCVILDLNGSERAKCYNDSGGLKIACDKVHAIGSYIVLEYTKTTE